jgi:alkylated DNA repair dioxygenase AlkB
MKSDEGELLLGVVADALSVMKCMGEKIPDYLVYGIYLNYYKNGDMYTPNHTHLKTHQLVISLGASRTFTIGKKTMTLNSGDAVLFGSAVHGVPKDSSVVDGRISIATFMSPISD